MKMTDTYSFEEYYLLLVDNISKKVLTKEILQNTREELLEVVNEMYYKEISPSIGVILLESFYSKFRKFLTK